MKSLVPVLLVFALFSFNSGCVAPLNPMINEDRSVSPAQDLKRTLTVIDGIVMTDGLMSHGIRFPGGTYSLEGEDDVYLYFVAPSPLEYRVFRNGQPIDGRFIPGGIALAKNTLRLVPAAGYMNGDLNKKTLTWKLGAEFLSAEGRRWTKSF